MAHRGQSERISTESPNGTSPVAWHDRLATSAVFEFEKETVFSSQFLAWAEADVAAPVNHPYTFILFYFYGSKSGILGQKLVFWGVLD